MLGRRRISISTHASEPPIFRAEEPIPKPCRHAEIQIIECVMPGMTEFGWIEKMAGADLRVVKRGMK